MRCSQTEVDLLTAASAIARVDGGLLVGALLSFSLSVLSSWLSAEHEAAFANPGRWDRGRQKRTARRIFEGGKLRRPARRSSAFASPFQSPGRT
jgi:hypothetical protein